MRTAHKQWHHQGFRLAGVVATLVLCLAVVAVPAAADPEERLRSIEQKREELQSQIERTNEKAKTLEGSISVLDGEAETLQSKLSELNAQINDLDGRISEVQADLELAQQRYSTLTEELLDIQADLVESTDSLTDRAVERYKAGPGAYVEGMLSAQSFSELSDRYQYYETTVELDSDLIDEIERLNSETDSRRDQVAQEKDRIADAKLQLEKDRADIASVQIEKQQLLDVQNAIIAEKEDVLRGQLTKKSELEELDSQLQKDSQEIQGLLSRPTGSGGSPTYTGGQFVWPANGSVTSPYGYRIHPIFGDSRLHTGVDIGAAYGSSVFAASGGRVAFAGTMGGYGITVVIDHGGGVGTTYNHMSGLSVSVGASVSRGQTVGSVGCSGYCTGPHLHFEVRVGGSPVDPMPYLQ